MNMPPAVLSRYLEVAYTKRAVATNPDHRDWIASVIAHNTLHVPPTGSLGWKPAKAKPKRQAKHRGKIRPGFAHLNLCNEERITKQKARREAVLSFVLANPDSTALETQAAAIAAGHRGSISTILSDLRALATAGQVRMMQDNPRVPARYSEVTQ